MARLEDRLPDNVPGDYFVDTSCIDCDTCRFVAPAVFSRSAAHEQSVVHRQPRAPEERRRAAMALVACPTSSIGTADKADVAAAASAFPEALSEDVYYCGYASEASYGASSYLIVRAGGNVLVDSPRASKPLLKRLRELGGARWMFLSHRDDVADHAVFARELGCERILHESDVGRDTEAVETRLRGSEPAQLAPDLVAVPVPGHTRGSAVLLYRGTYLFTGDHLAGDDDGADRLHAWRSVCWYSWAEQTRSMERLLELGFSWVLPGHGRVLRAQSPDVMKEKLVELIARMRRS
jgi:glyoxylase-like metal-dependent hydrolase (beta-lactamase superfamily II)/ferredoxin